MDANPLREFVGGPLDGLREGVAKTTLRREFFPASRPARKGEPKVYALYLLDTDPKSRTAAKFLFSGWHKDRH